MTKVWVAFDIETTGQNILDGDKIVAIGAAAFVFGESGHTIESTKWCLDLKKPETATWEEFWEIKGWEKRCYREFWSDKLELLQKLQDEKSSLVESEVRLAWTLSQYLATLEETHGEFIIIFDTIVFDPVWLDLLLRKHGFAGLSRNRDGTGWRSIFEVDSYRFGQTKTPLGDWNELYQRVSKHMTAENVKQFKDHDPQDDAEKILWTAYAASKLQ